MAIAGEPSNARLRAACTSAWLTTVLALGVAGCGGEDAALGVSTGSDDGRASGDAGAVVSDEGASDDGSSGEGLSDASTDEPTATTTATDASSDPSGTDSTGDSDETLDGAMDAATPPSSDSSGDGHSEQPPTTSDAAETTAALPDAGVTADEVTPAEPSVAVEVLESYTEPGYCSVYVEQGERGHRIDCTVVVGDVWSCYSFTPVAPYAEFYLADQHRYTVSAPPTEDVCSLLVAPLFEQGPDAFTGDGDDCEQLQGSAGPRRWQAQVCGPKTLLDSDFVAWEGQPELVATCERRNTPSTAAICGCGQTAIEREYVANDHDDVAAALAATWLYCNTPEPAALTGSLSCEAQGLTEGDNFCMIETTCSQPEQNTADSTLTSQRHFDRRVTSEPVTGTDEPTVACACEGVIDGLASVSFAADDGTGETCEAMFALCKPGQPEIAGPAVCTLVDDYQLAEQGCGVALSCTVPLLISGAPAETTTKADMYCTKISDTTVSCSSGAEELQALFDVTESDFGTACDTASAQFLEASEQAPVLP